MKKIVYFIPTFSAISETFILREVQTLMEFGNLDLKVLALQEGAAKLPENIKKNVIYYRPSFFDVILVAPFILLSLGRVISTFKIILNENEGSFNKNVITFLKSIFYARKIKSLNPNHIHAHFLSNPSTLMMFVSSILDLPFSISGHATDVVRDHEMVKAKVKRAKFVALCNSGAYQETIKLSGGKGRKNIILLYHGIDYLKFRFKKRIFNTKSQIQVLADARFVEKKGLDILSQAVVNLNQIFDIRLNLVGFAQNESQLSYMNSLKQIFKNASFDDKLNIPNNGKGLQQDEVANLYSECDVFIYAGIDAGKGDIDGVPNALLQAAFSGLPVITTQSGSISDLFDEKNSYIINQSDVNDLVIKFQEMLKDESRLDKSDLLYKQAGKEFSLILNVKELEGLLIK
jgi:glycosyltransferase involved in cell wall biosynthesis